MIKDSGTRRDHYAEIKEKRRAIIDFCKEQECETCKLTDSRICNVTTHDSASEEIVDEAYKILYPPEKPTIKDSGSRREFESGAVRDIQEGKGRCDLMPLDVVAEFITSPTLAYISRFQEDGKTIHLKDALSSCGIYHSYYEMFLEVSKHFEEGAKKYGEHNWQKGIPTHCYIDSAVRHYLKWLRGDVDEPHDRAFVWNILCCIWTCTNKPEFNDYGKEKKNDND